MRVKWLGLEFRVELDADEPGLILTSLLGATIALTSAATRKSAAIALVLGTVLPTVLLFL